MNAIMDLTARATSFITVVQTTLLNHAIKENDQEDKISILTLSPEKLKAKLESYIAHEKKVTAGNKTVSKDKKPEELTFEDRAIELVWISSKTPDRQKITEYTIKICVDLSEWLWENKPLGIQAMQDEYKEYPTPYNWREAINNILYKDHGKRKDLAVRLRYMPMQVVLALGGGEYTAREQRVLQMWTDNEDEKMLLLNRHDRLLLGKLKTWQLKLNINAGTLLKDEDKLLECLNRKNIPLSFEHVLKAELQEILKNRSRRENEQLVTNGYAPVELNTETLEIDDPFRKGKEMELYALAFSGGGIRSATFNLGILEGLAQNNLLGKFDYLSTVSGGGYIGSWLATWIKRDGSVVKVSNRLCPDKSPDPFGEEVKPIKWLRMFSNYFAPDASIMSADTWTVGITWLRNTLLNQVIIFLLLLSLLFTWNFLYMVWSVHLQHPVAYHFQYDMPTYRRKVLEWSALLLIPVSFLAGLGMHAYHSERVRGIAIKRTHTKTISMFIVGIAVVGAFIMSAWLSSTFYIDSDSMDPVISVGDKMKIFWPEAVTTFVCLFAVAMIGRYFRLIRNFNNGYVAAVLIVMVTTLIATVVGLAGLAWASVLLDGIPDFQNKYILIKAGEFQFIFGVPLTLEVFSTTVVIRMGLLGKYFPDERREWWGRMGAYIHRISFLWIMIAASALLGQKFMYTAFNSWGKPGIAAAGGWIALVGSAVKAAFSSKTSGKDNKKGGFAKFLNILGKSGPYLFALGLLIFLPGLIEPLLTLERKLFTHAGITLHSDMLENLSMIFLSILMAYLLARQVGVNEFSMHHFYRNRLVRAYLGATRRSTDRQRTSNPFTGFDIRDDEKLFGFQNQFGYYGPYPVLNTALNASQKQDLDRQDRKAESFIFSPLFCGFDFSMTRASADAGSKSYDHAYRNTRYYADKDDGPTIGTAMAVSGAAVNPNQGYHSSAATAFLLTVFNVQMGRWIGNPRRNTWQSSDPKLGLAYIFSNMIGKTSTRDKFIALSDGGHFDNMGIYEMVRRRCAYIILCDAEQDDQFNCEGFANAIRRCRVDFGAEIKIDITPVITRDDNRFSKVHYASGTIRYAGDKVPSGKILYIKSSITGSIPVDVHEYALKNETFPHQTTADQFFDEEQFESYRRLGLHIGNIAFSDKEVVTKFKLKESKSPSNVAGNNLLFYLSGKLKKFLQGL